MNGATERGLNTNMAFKNKSFSKPTEDVYKIFLAKDEILMLANLEIPKNNIKSIIRDYFIIGCCTSLRYSDLIRIKKENIKNECIYMTTVKTSQEVIIPISPLVKLILEKYNYELPKAPCNQIFNRYLKEIGKSAGLTEKQDWLNSPYGGQNPVQDLLFQTQLTANCIWEDFFSKKENHVDYDRESLKRKILEMSDLTPELREFFKNKLNTSPDSNPWL